MDSRTIDQEKLAELMHNGWSWVGSSGSSGGSDIMVDETTGKRYRLHITNGDLTMTEVTV